MAEASHIPFTQENKQDVSALAKLDSVLDRLEAMNERLDRIERKIGSKQERQGPLGRVLSVLGYSKSTQPIPSPYEYPTTGGFQPPY